MQNHPTGFLEQTRNSLHRKQTYNLLLILIVATLASQANALINVPVSQSSNLKPFIFSDIHAYFDISYEGQGNLVQGDDNATYMFSKISERSANMYQFVVIPHSTQKPQTVYDSIQLDGVQVFGMCQYGGSLDYVVALDIASNELRVIRFTFSGTSGQTFDYKVIDKDNEFKKLTGTVYIDCSYQTTYKGFNSYVIAVAGTYFHENQISSYYLAKFSTKYNFTEYMVLSEDPQTMEAACGVRIDLDNNMIYLAVEINKQKYHGSTVYPPGGNPGQDNANVAIHGYSWSHGVRIWTTVIGNENFTDQFSRMEHWGNYLFVLLNSFSIEYSATSNLDIYYYRIRALTGVIEVDKIFGSPLTDKALDFRITFMGLYILTYMNDQFMPHRFNDKIWQTQNGNPSVSLVWMDFEDNILNIEGYDLGTLSFSNYPQKFFVPRLGNSSSTMQSFVFISPRSNDPVDQWGGYFVTYFQNGNVLFYQTASCGVGCAQCSSQDPSYCIKCNWAPTQQYQIYKHVCYPIYQCPDFTYNVFDDQGKMMLYCQDCHYSCKNCTGPHNDQCSSCCTENICGAILNRVPNLGTCNCPNGLIDSSGSCVQRCVLDLHGRSQGTCYPQCPANSLPQTKYDDPVKAQEKSQYDGASPTDCSQSTYHLKFKNGNGLPIEGPDLSVVPSEFTMALWVKPDQLYTKSYFLNAFNRVQVFASLASLAVQFQYTTGPNPTDIVEPTYIPAHQQVLLSAWNYISISFRTYLNGNVQMYEQVLAIAQNNMGVVYQAGYSNSHPSTTFTDFTNTIYLGAYNDINPQSFTGYLKEFRLFTNFHGFAQMQDDQLRMYRYYSYDDPYLVAYWKLTENYQPTDIEYTINDYSINQNKITYSKISKPLYPQFIFDDSFALSLCSFHDVEICLSLDYSQSHPSVVSQSRIAQNPTFNIQDLSYTKQTGDQIWYVPNNTACIPQNIKASLQFLAAPVYEWFMNDNNYNPSVNLTMGEHYQVCYFSNSLNIAFNLYQIYVIELPTTIDPSTSNAFQTTGVTRLWGSIGGDQSYSDFIKFSKNCDHTTYEDYEMYRNTLPSFGTHFMTNFTNAGDYYFCWMPTFVQDMKLPYYHPIHDLRFKIVSVPSVSTSALTNVIVNENIVHYDFYGAFVEGDILQLSWSGLVVSDCNPINFVGITYARNYSYWPAVWFGHQTGVYGVTNTSMDSLHLCYMSIAQDSPGAWSRIKKTTGTAYFVQILGYQDTTLMKCPELVGFYPIYGSTELYETDTQIRFWFNNEAVYPSRASDGNLTTPFTPGQIVIYRGGLRPDGTIIRTNEILWQGNQLNDIGQVNPLTQGNLLCNGFGQCTIMLSDTQNLMKGGEIFFLSFYLYSFSYKLTPHTMSRYYLFNNLTLEVGQDAAYNHLFFCRSFNVSYSDQKINGATFAMHGVDLRYKLIRQVLNMDTSVQALFQTRAINLYLRVVNTIDSFCTGTPPIATVNIQDVFQTNFTVSNLNLRMCNEGMLVGDIELVRATQDQFGKFTHVRSEWHKNIKIGDINCDKTCQFCNGTTYQNCFVCKNSIPFLTDGQCYAQCPDFAPYYMSNIVVWQKMQWSAPYCIPQCPLGYYPDSITKECFPCNLDCQTCNTQAIKSCLTCKPVKYLFNGLCVSNCPAPHYINNFNTYMCDKVSQTKFLNVTIQSLGYKLKIPKDQQTYLRAIINNEGGGDIVSIIWSQLEPVATALDMLVFTVNSDGTVQNTAPAVRMKMTALNYIASNQVVKVQCTVVNSVGEIAYDIYEFFQNSPPDQLSFQATSLLSFQGRLGAGNGTTGDSVYVFNATNWDDPDYVSFKVFMIVSNVYMTLSDQVSQVLPISSPTMIYFRIPILSTTSTSQFNIQVCVQATDNDFATSTNCTQLTNLTNNPSYGQNLTKLTAQLLPLQYAGNLTNAVYAAQMMYLATSQPLRPPSSPGICSLDFHCNLKGTCQSVLGNQRCICSIGYSGSFCQYHGSQLNDLVKINSQILTALYQSLTSVPEITVNEIENVGVILRGILNDPDIVEDSYIEQIIEMLEMVGGASIYAHYPVTIDIRNMYMDSLSAVMNKLYHSYKLTRAYPDVAILQKNGSLAEQYNAEIVSSRRRILSGTTNTALLITGVSQRMAFKKTLANQTNGSTYQQWSRRLDAQVTIFITKFLPSMNPIYPNYNYTSNVIQLNVQNSMAQSFKDINIYISEKDVVWYIPQSVFNNAQGQASDKHEVYMKVQKYLANPFFFEGNPGAYVESNVTELTFYDGGGNRINVTISNENDYIIISEPYIKTQNYQSELLRCMSWDESNENFLNDGSCSYNNIYEIVPCTTCQQGVVLNLSVSLCRCKHLSRFATVYTQTSPSKGRGPLVGIYVNFQSMAFWSKSFGMYATITAIFVYLFLLAIFVVIDHYTIPKVVDRVFARVKKLELKGFKQKEQKKMTVLRDDKGKIIFVRHFAKIEEKGDMVEEILEAQEKDKKIEDDDEKVDAVIDLQKLQDDEDNAKKKKGDEENVAEAYLSPKKPKGKNGGMSSIRKAFENEEDEVAQVVKGKNDKQGPKEEAKVNEGGKSKKGKKQAADEHGDGGYINEYGEWMEGSNPDHDDNEEEEEEEDIEAIEAKKKADEELHEKQMIARFEEEKEIMDFLKEHGEEDQDDQPDDKFHNKEQKLYLKIERRARERYWFNLKSLIIHGNGILSMIFIDSMLMPRHVRFTLFYTNVLLNFLWCALILSNNEQQLLLPDVGSSSPGVFAQSQLWIPMAAPIGTTIVMYIFAGLFKISDARVNHSYTLVYLEKMLVELKKEMKMRFIIAYSITMAVYAACFWYIIKFTSAYGWQISWVWFYCGCFSVLFQYTAYDIGIAFTQWIFHWCSKTVSLFWMQIRMVKMCRQEA